MGGTSSKRATSFMTEMDVKPCCLWPKSKRGMIAAFLYWGGYFFKISSIRFLLSALNSKGILALFSAVSRCWKIAMVYEKTKSCWVNVCVCVCGYLTTYHKQRVWQCCRRWMDGSTRNNVALNGCLSNKSAYWIHGCRKRRGVGLGS